jgi:hypothetical protein
MNKITTKAVTKWLFGRKHLAFSPRAIEPNYLSRKLFLS